MNLFLCSFLAIISMALGDLSPIDYALPGNIDDWPELKSLGEFANNIDRFTKITKLFVIITKDDRVYVFGNQTMGKSFDAIDGDTGPQPIEVTELSGKKIVRIEFFNGELIALSEDESIWILKTKRKGYYWNSSDLYARNPEHNGKGLRVRGKAHPIPLTPFPCDETNPKEKHCKRNNTFTIENMNNVLSCRMSFEDYGVIYVNRTHNARYIVEHSEFEPHGIHAIYFKTVDMASTHHNYFVLAEDGKVYRRQSRVKVTGGEHPRTYLEQYNRGMIKRFYNGTLKFQQLYSDFLSHPSYLVGRARDGGLYVLEDVNKVRALNTADIVHAFATDRPEAYLPFMVKIDTRGREVVSEKNLAKEEEACRHASQLMKTMFNNHSTSDTKFEVGNKTIEVHRSILVSSSAFMSTQFAGAWRSKSSVQVFDYTYEVYKDYLRFLYTDGLDVNATVALDLYVLASNLKEDRLKERCLQIILPNTNTTTTNTDDI